MRESGLVLEVIQPILSPQPVPTPLSSTHSRNRNATSYPTHPLNPYATFSSSRQSVASSHPKPKTSEVSAFSNAEHDLAEPVVASTKSSVPRPISANSIDDLFTNLLADSSPTHSSLEQENTKSSTNRRDKAHALEGEEMTLPLANPNERDISLKRKIQHNRRKIFRLVAFGFIILAFIIVALNNNTAFLPLKTSTLDTPVHQKPTQDITQSLIPLANPTPSNAPTIQATVLSPSTNPTTQPTMSSSSATSTSSHPTPSSSPNPTPTTTPTQTLHTTTIDDSAMGTGLNQFDDVGSGWQHSLSECPGPNCHGTLPYNGSNSWDTQTNDYVTIRFTGVQIKFYGMIDVPHGIGAVSIDRGTETMVDFYATTREGNQLLWTSPTLPTGTHTFKLRVTGNKNPNASNTAVVPDRVDILG